MASNCMVNTSESVNLVSVMMQISGYSSMSSSRSRKDRGVYLPRIGEETNFSRVGILAQLMPSCQSACHQSWRSTTWQSRVRRRSASNTRTPASYWVRKPSRQFRVFRFPTAPMPWAITVVPERMSGADSAPSGGCFSSTGSGSPAGSSGASSSSAAGIRAERRRGARPLRAPAGPAAAAGAGRASVKNMQKMSSAALDACDMGYLLWTNNTFFNFTP